MSRAYWNILLPALLLAVLFALVSSPAASGQKGATGASLSKPNGVELLGVSFEPDEGPGKAIIKVSGQCEYSTLLLADPPRLVLDLSGVKLGGDPEKKAVGKGIVRSIRISQFDGNTTRVVFDLASEVGFSVKKIEPADAAAQEIIVAFNSIVKGVLAGLEGGRFVVRVPGFSFAGAGENPGKDRNPGSEGGVRAFALTGPDRIVVDLPQATLARDAVREVTVHDELVKGIRLSQFDASTVRMVLDLRKAQPYKLVTSEDGGVALDLGYRLKSLQFDSGLEGTEVKLGLSGDAPLSVKKADGDNLLTIDIEDTVSSMGDRVIPVNDGVISEIRIEEPAPFKLRISLALRYYVAHKEPIGEGSVKKIFVTRSPLYGKILAIDPGHGGTDPGAISPTGLQEKFVTLDIGLQLAELLSSAGASAILTRKDDTYVSLPDRVDLANKAPADAFVSIHANSVSELHPSGTETFYFEGIQDSKTLADAIHDALVAGIGLIDRRAKPRELYVLKWTKMPACLVEVAFLSNLTEEQLLMDPAFRSKVAKSLFDGLWNFFKQRETPQNPKAPEKAGGQDLTNPGTDLAE